MTRVHPHTTILVLNHEEMQHFSALMQLRRHPPGEEKDDATYFVIKMYNEDSKCPAGYRIHIFDRSDYLTLTNDLAAAGLSIASLDKRTASMGLQWSDL